MRKKSKRKRKANEWKKTSITSTKKRGKGGSLSGGKRKFGRLKGGDGWTKIFQIGLVHQRKRTTTIQENATGKGT